MTTAVQQKNYDIANINLAERGRFRMQWAGREMPVLDLLEERFHRERPFAGVRMAAAMHVTSETANLMRILIAGGAEIALCASNPLSTQDDIAAALVAYYEMPVYAIRGETTGQYNEHLNAVLDTKPHLTMDDGMDLVAMLHTQRSNLLQDVVGGTEETTTGVIRLRAMAAQGNCHSPVIAVNDAMTKHFFDNRYGTGQSTLDGIIRATNVLVAGKSFVVVGYGWCSKGIAMRAKGMGANVHRHRGGSAAGAGSCHGRFPGDADGPRSQNRPDLLRRHRRHSRNRPPPHGKMRDGAILANSGHFDVEINLKALEEMSTKITRVRDFLDEYALEDGRRLYVAGEGRLVKSGRGRRASQRGDGHEFANQALAAEYLLKNSDEMSGNLRYARSVGVARLRPSNSRP